MRKLGITISFRKIKEEPKHPEPIFTSAYYYDNQDSAKFPRSNSLSRHAVMVPPCKTSHTFFTRVPVGNSYVMPRGHMFQSRAQRRINGTGKCIRENTAC